MKKVSLAVMVGEIFSPKKMVPLAVSALVVGTVMIASAEEANAACVQQGACFQTFQNVGIGASANFGGFGEGVFHGKEGFVRVEKGGWGHTDLTLNMEGGLCGGVNCAAAGNNFHSKAGAGQFVETNAGAFGNRPGQAVGAFSEGGAFSSVTSSFNSTGQRLTAP